MISPLESTSVMVSASEGGVIRFGSDITLTIPADALAEDTEIEITEFSDGLITIQPFDILSYSGGKWEELDQSIEVDDSGTTINPPLDHFSNNFAVEKGANTKVSVLVLPGKSRRFVGEHFSVRA